MRALVADGSSVILTTHYLEEAEALAQRVVVLGKGRVLSEGSVDELRAHVAMSRIRCRTDLDAGSVAAWPDVASVEREGAYLVIQSASPESVMQRLLASGSDLAGLEVKRAGLAEAFAEITGNEDIREAA